MKRFPVLPLYGRKRKKYKDYPKYIPWEIIKQHEEQAMINHCQSLERLAIRGGLSPDEILVVIEHRKWRPMNIERAINKLNQIIKWVN